MRQANQKRKLTSKNMIFDTFAFSGMSTQFDFFLTPSAVESLVLVRKQTSSKNAKSQIRIKIMPIRFGHGWSLLRLFFGVVGSGHSRL